MTTSIPSIRKFASVLILEHIQQYPHILTEPVMNKFEAAVLFADIKGFTQLTDKYTKQDPEGGVKDLARVLNIYMGNVVDIVTEYGGDVVKFAGDALFAIWRVEEGATLGSETHRAVKCGVEIQKRLDNFPVEDEVMKLRIGLGAGNMVALHVGGAFDRWELLLAGEPMNQVGKAGTLAEPGQVVISSRVRKVIESIGAGHRINANHFILSPYAQSDELRPTQCPVVPPEAAEKLQTYIPRAILNRMENGKDPWDADYRPVSVMFLKVTNFEFRPDLHVSEVQYIMRMMQNKLYKHEGSVNRFGIDDKGAVLLAAFGLPPLYHGDDPWRAVIAAQEIRQGLENLGYGALVGISTGNAFCGSVGNEIRCEYTMHGNNVNFAARLMTNAQTILVDENTYQATKEKLNYQALDPIRVKGREDYVNVYRPIFEQD